MPEGHAIHRLAGRFNRDFAGTTTRSVSPQGRFVEGCKIIDGQILSAAEAFGKHLLLEFAEIDRWVRVHLGIYGTWSFGTDPGVIGQIRWRIMTENLIADLRGPAACEVIDADDLDRLLARLGPDPLRPDADPERAWLKISRSRAPLATLLMDQSVIAGVGNIYRAEVLFRHGLDPLLAGTELGREEFDAIWNDLVGLMKLGVEAGRIDTVRDEHTPERMGRAAREDAHGGEVYVYRRAGQECLVCGSEIHHREIGARNLFWCPKCQSRP